MSRNHPYFPYVCLVTAAFLWASTFVALKLAFQVYDPMVVIFGRMLVASLFALFFPFVFKNVEIRKKDIKRIGLMVLCEPCLYFVFEAKALVYTTAAQAGMLTAMMPAMVAIGAWLILKEQLTPRTCMGFVVAVCGALWLSLASQASEHGPNPLLGNFLEFMAMVCATGYALTLKKLTHRFSPLFLTFVQAFAGSIFFFPALFLPGTQLPVEAVPLPLIAIFYLGSAVTLGAYGLYNYGVSKIPASQATSFINLIPVFSLIMSAIVLGERFTLVQYAASLMVLSGVILTQDRRARKQPVQSPETQPTVSADKQYNPTQP